jgi:hypothetical protein
LLKHRRHLSSCSCIHFIENFAIEVVLFVPIVVVGFFSVGTAKLVAIHSSAQLFGYVCHAGPVSLLRLIEHHFQRIDESLFGVVKFGKLNGEIECVDQLVRLCLNAFS